MRKNLKKLLAVALMVLLPLGVFNMAAAEDVLTPITRKPVESETPAAMPAQTNAPVVTEQSAARNVTVTIVWKDDNNANNTRPKTVSVSVMGSDGSQRSTQAQRPADGKANTHKKWQVTLKDLPRMSGQKEIEYSAQVIIPEGYRCRTDGLKVYLTLIETAAVPASAENEEPAAKTETLMKQSFTPMKSEESAKETETPVKNEEFVTGTKKPVTSAAEENRAPAAETGNIVNETFTPMTHKPPKTETTAPVETPAPAEGEEPVEAAEAPAEGIQVITYERDENGCLVLDVHGMPIAIVAEGMDIPVEYLRDETGALVLNEYGDPIPTQTVPAGSQKLQTLADLLDPNRSIDVYASWEGDTLYFGDEMTLIVVLHGYEKATYTLQWQVSADANTWTDIEGATGITTKVLVTEENYLNYWRVQVVVTAVDGQ